MYSWPNAYACRLTPGALLIPLALAALAGWWLVPCPAHAFTFTPFVNFEGGYDDNVRLRREPQSDFFFSVRPGFRLMAGPPSNQFFASASVLYTHYFRLRDLSNFEGGQAMVRYTNEPSQLWRWEVWDSYSFTYDAPTLDEDGNVIAVDEFSGRRDTNTVGVRTTYTYNLMSAVSATYAYSSTWYEEDSDADSESHRVSASWSHRFNQDWLGATRAYWYRDLYNNSEDIDRFGGGVTVTRMFGPTARAFVDLAYYDVRAITDDPIISDRRNYQRYSVSVGFSQEPTQTFSWGFSVGWATVEGSQISDLASDAGSPIASFHAAYTGQRWRAGVVASSDLGEYDVMNENRGLASTQRITAYYGYEFTQRLRFSLSASFLRTNYKQDEDVLPASATNDDYDAYVLTAELSYRLTRWSTAGVRYRYLERDALNDDDDRTQNRIMLFLNLQQPYRW